MEWGGGISFLDQGISSAAKPLASPRFQFPTHLRKVIPRPFTFQGCVMGVQGGYSHLIFFAYGEANFLEDTSCLPQ